MRVSPLSRGVRTANRPLGRTDCYRTRVTDYLDMELRAGDAAATRRLFERVISLRLSSKKIKYFFSRYLAYARSQHDEALAQHVKDMARAWVESATN